MILFTALACMIAFLHTTIACSPAQVQLLFISPVIPLIRKLQDALGNRAVFFCLIGYTHHDRRSLDIVEDEKVMRFYAPDRIRKRVREWELGEFDRRYNEALQAYIRHSRLASHC